MDFTDSFKLIETLNQLLHSPTYLQDISIHNYYPYSFLLNLFDLQQIPQTLLDETELDHNQYLISFIIKINKNQSWKALIFPIIVILCMKIKQTVTQSLAFLGAAISQGQPIKGVEHSPQLLRKTGLFDYLNENYKVKITDYGDIEVLTEQKTKYPPVEFAVKNLNVLGQVLGRIHDQVYNIVQKKQTQFLLTVGGDHSMAAATISGVKRHHKDLRVIWVDAHPDFTNSHMRNPTKMHNQNYHGMPLSHLTGATSIPPLDYWKWITDQPHLDPKNVVLIGIRDIDADEYISLKKYGVKCFTMDHVDMYGIGSVMNQAIEHLDPKNEHPFHLSFDVDGIDPDVVSQTGTRFRYGLSARQAVHIVRRLSHQRRLVSMDLVQINQSLNKNQQIRKKYRGEEMLKDPSETFGLSIDLVASVYTKYLTI